MGWFIHPATLCLLGWVTNFLTLATRLSILIDLAFSRVDVLVCACFLQVLKTLQGVPLDARPLKLELVGVASAAPSKSQQSKATT